MPSTRLDALAEFLVVARHRSFTAAAAELGVTTSALSQAVRQLERRLGIVLLTRTTRSVALTEPGRRLVEEAGPGVARALEALRGAGTDATEVSGKVRLTVPQLAVPTVIEPVVPIFRARHPRVALEVRVENRMVDVVAEGYDGGIRLEESLERDMVQLRLTGSAAFLVAGAPSYLAARGTPQRPRDLLSHDCIGYCSETTGSPYAWELVRGKRLFRVPVRGPLVSNDERLVRSMVEAGLGLGYLYEPLAQDGLRSGRLRQVLAEYAAEVPGLFLYYPARSVSPPFRAFIEVCREVLGPRKRPAPPRPGPPNQPDADLAARGRAAR
jgi:DNA-binding transcriptional LysR family regulator